MRWALALGALLLAAAATAYATDLGALGAAWFKAAPGSLNAFQAMVQRYLLPSLWTEAVVPVLRQPAWLVALVPGLLLVVLAGLLRARR
jgi:hypothetical protein